ncbi:MAG: branched-chain amino acid ABC transporter permease [Burkholderiaceae bacterium]|nr:branched-chain amino acid ABC transporter permease [Burkholderiaceae bacterium]
MSVMTFTFILGVLAVSFNLVYGITGQLTLFHAAAFGLGAYATHLSMLHWEVSFWTGTAFAMAFVTVFAVVLGFICFRFRLKEFYFAVVTLAFAEIVRLVVLNWHSLTNGSLGINFSLKPTLWVPGMGLVEIKGPLIWYYFALAVLMLALVFYTAVVRSWAGQAFQAIRLNEDLAAAIGINAFRYKLLSFVLGSIGASLAGSLYAY